MDSISVDRFGTLKCRSRKPRGLLKFVLVKAASFVAPVSAHADNDWGLQAWESGNIGETISEWIKTADTKEGRAILALGRAHRQELGVSHNYVQAHKWFNLAASRGDSEAIKERGAMDVMMAESERAEARALALQWRPGGSETVPAAPIADEEPVAQGIRNRHQKRYANLRCCSRR